MRNSFVALIVCVPLALSGCTYIDEPVGEPTAHVQEPPVALSEAKNPSYLFTVVAAAGSTAAAQPFLDEDERFTLSLSGVDSVTKFADRPLRAASVLSPQELDSNWSSWFADSPPNAVLTFAGRSGLAPQSIVITLTEPRYDAIGRTLMFTALRTYRTVEPSQTDNEWKRPATPRTFTMASLFIDNSGDSQTGSLVDALTQAMQQYALALNDPKTWADVESAVSSVLTTAWKQGILTGPTQSSAFSVSLGLGTTMTADDILNGILRVTVRMQLSSGKQYVTTLTQQQATSG
jgi:hypothetical protein